MNPNDYNTLDIAIVIFAFQRTEHLQKALNALKQNEGFENMPVYFFIDKSEDNVGVIELCKKRWSNKQHLICRKEHYGLLKNITLGLDDIANQHSSFIVIEDDIVVSPFFIEFIVRMLEKYQNDETIGHINGYCPPFRNEESFYVDTYEVPNAWGWATWSKTWKKFRASDVNSFADTLAIKKLIPAFNRNCNNSYHFRNLLKGQDWDAQWYAYFFIHQVMCITPNQSLVQNIGFDKTATHSTSLDKYFFHHQSLVKKLPDVIPFEKKNLQRLIDNHHKKIYGNTIKHKIRNYLLKNFHLAFKDYGSI